MAIETNGVEFEAAVARAVAAKRATVTQLARIFGLPEPFTTDEDRVARRKAAAAVPASCGPEIIAAPARGATVRFAPIAVTPKGAEGFEVTHVGYRGRDAARAADAFDVMERQAKRKRGEAYRPLFTARQVAAGRRYADLVERHGAVGMRCASVEALAAGSGGGSGAGSGSGDYLDAVIHEGRVIAAMERAIGAGVALAPKRASAKGRVITCLDLVQLVTLRGMTISQCLQARRWAASPIARGALHKALCAALDRMA
ncbi:hypothetical protein SAMN05877809_10718 [Rhodobacter sp. JA431]|uniref:hypothetical protein n=1 Tax=Rhodobacter sp. JA431 TaxID=570013 RepID=UPI000BCBC048|nr:hypothetical protein [Rhodobacter sp. JA431]SOC13807.1 hypothetical protein SAMN05877809_10718 [Rhodobacter sp. JA431]